MRILGFILILLVGLTVLAQTPDYFSDNPKWHCSIYDSDQWSSPPNPSTQYFVYYINGDTLAGGNSYQRIFKRGYVDYDLVPGSEDESIDEPTQIYVRQEGRAIYYFDMTDEVDSLLVNYDLEVGDEIGTVSECWMMTDTIQKVDSILVGGEYHRTLYLDSLNGPIIFEGIGHLSEPGFSAGHMFLNYCQGIGFSYHLLCYGKGTTSTWDYEYLSGGCALNLGFEKKSEFDFTAYVDQHNQQLIVSLPTESLDLRLISVDGEVLNFWPNVNGIIEIDVSHFSSGIYCLNVSSGSDSQSLKVFIR
ncbi:MAG: T9SS type A sorting domain-containing protein [Crocinitomicaceae bacterium]|nr:T9SS type A sorting domain-containing protein [Crocinitomicaceae bacterium]